MPILPRLLKLSCPKANLVGMGDVFKCNIVPAIASIGKRPPLLDHCGIQAALSDKTFSNDPFVLVAVFFFAADGFVRRQIFEKCCGLLSAWIRLAVKLTLLSAFWRIDPVQADDLTIDLEAIPINDESVSDNFSTSGLHC